ncbi:MAG: DUF697 domain-containing protein [Calditrichaeota bacterium]|nr:DUF697 domain-containing protein [Calditrichota bacterium]
MKKSLQSFAIIISIFIIVLFVIFVINQTAQVVQLAASLNPWFGTAVGWSLVVIYIVLILGPVVLFLRLPKPLIPPEDVNSVEFPIYLEKLSKRLAKNQRVHHLPLSTKREIEDALKVLNGDADQIIRKQATLVFVTTAISQSGRLDTFTVLLAQIRMVWQIARLYYQRPVLREVIQLYANVMATAFVAGELNDIDISRQIEPIVSSVLGASLTGSIPGVNLVAGIITNSLLGGSANAYLTLRVGIIAKKYSGSLLSREKSVIRKSSSLEAARMLSVIVMNSAGSITRSIVNAAIKSPGKISRDILKSTWGRILGKERPEQEYPVE